MKRKLGFLGGLGDPLTIASAIVDGQQRAGDETVEIAGFLNDRLAKGEQVGPYAVLGGLDEAEALIRSGCLFVNGIYRIDGNQTRIDMFEALGIPDEQLFNFIHPTAYVAPGVRLGPGCILMPNVCVSQTVSFGKGCIVLQGASVGHDNTIADYVHISAQACLGAYLNIGRGVHIGMNATVREHVSMGAYSALGMGSALLGSTQAYEIWVGNPARLLRQADA